MPTTTMPTTTMTEMQIGPVLTEIMSHKFAAVTEEMTTNLKRASRSVYVKEAADFGVGLVDLAGHIFAFPRSTSIVAIDQPCGPTIAAVGPLEEGDVIITNDPYRSHGLATHLPDLQIVHPYFHDGRVIAYGWCFVHFMDVGGRVPSSITPSNTEIFQEGLILPPMKLVRRGELNMDIIAVLAANCRLPDQNVADIKAMLGAMETGRRRVADIIAQHGVDTFLAAQMAVQDYTAAKARAVLRRLRDGVYDFWDFMDDDLVSRVPVRMRVRMTVADGKVELDATGTDPPVNAAYNLPSHGQCHPWLVLQLSRFILTHDSTMPLNFGIYRHISAINPPGTVLNAAFPAAVGIRQAVAHRFNDAVNGALMAAAPEMTTTPGAGIVVPIVLAEADDGGGKRNVTVIEPLVGGTGAWDGNDGVDSRESSMSNLSNHPMELVELDIGAIIREYDIRMDSGGPGKWRGGTGQVLTFEVLKDGGAVLGRGMERMRFAPWGYNGGRAGHPLRAILNRGRADERELRKLDSLAVNAGDTVTFLSPGGGGYGDPFQRDVQAVLQDVRRGFVSRDAALRDFGVAIGPSGELDMEATTQRRGPAKSASVSFDFGAERNAWETVFDDATMRDLNQRLALLPKASRSRRRREIFEAAVPALKNEGVLSLATSMVDAQAAVERLRTAMVDLPKVVK